MFFYFSFTIYLQLGFVICILYHKGVTVTILFQHGGGDLRDESPMQLGPAKGTGVKLSES